MTAAVGLLDIQALLGEPDRSRKTARLQYLAQSFRLTVFDILHEKGTGHWDGASSAAELLVSLYFHAMNVRPEEPRWMDRDRLVLSEGHAWATPPACSTRCSPGAGSFRSRNWPASGSSTAASRATLACT